MNNIIVVFPSGSLTPKDRERLSKNGYCAVEAQDPSKVQIILPGKAIHADDFSMAAIEALSGRFDDGQRSIFARALFDRIKTRANNNQGEAPHE